MKEVALRGWLAKQLKMSDVPDRLWDFLKDGWYVSEALDDERPEGRAELFGQAKKLLALGNELGGGRARSGGTVRPAVPQPVLGDYERQRSFATWDYLALHASRTPRVRHFRARYQGGHPLSEDQALRLLNSPAAALLMPEVFEKRGIPIAKHHSKIVNRYEERSTDRALTVETTIRFEWEGGTHEEMYRWRRGSGRRPPEEVLNFCDGQRKRRGIRIWRHSVLDKLRELSVWLAKRYGWDQEAAVWFVLTDDPMPRLPLQTDINAHLRASHTDSEITLTVEPWVSADVVLRAYRDIQREILGRENRPLSERNLEMFRFVIQQERDEEIKSEGDRERLTWARLMAYWNRSHPSSSYSEERLFARDVSRAQRAVVFPRYRFAANDGQEDT